MTPMQIMVFRMSSIKRTDLVQRKPNAELYYTSPHQLLSVQRVKCLASEINFQPLYLIFDLLILPLLDKNHHLIPVHSLSLYVQVLEDGYFEGFQDDIK